MGGGGGGRAQKMNYLGRRCILNCGLHSKCENTEEKLLPLPQIKIKGYLHSKGLGFARISYLRSLSFNRESSLINCSSNSAPAHHMPEGLACFSSATCMCFLPLHFAAQGQIISIKELDERRGGFYEIFKRSCNYVKVCCVLQITKQNVQ